MSRQQRLVAKLVLCGSWGVGKTSIRRNFMGDHFVSDHLSTLGADFSVNRIDLGDEIVLELQIWDLAGQSGFDNLRQRFFKGASAALMVFDLTRSETFTELESWFEQLWRNQDSKEMPITILGNKEDLGDVQVTDDEVRKFIDKLKQENNLDSYMDYFHTSAKTGLNIEKCFTEISKVLYDVLSKED